MSTKVSPRWPKISASGTAMLESPTTATALSWRAWWTQERRSSRSRATSLVSRVPVPRLATSVKNVTKAVA